MPVTVTILPELATAYVHYSVKTRIDEVVQAFIAYTQHPDYRQGQKQFIDMRQLSAVDPDHTSAMRLQALAAEYFIQPDAPVMICFLAPTAIAREMAAMSMRSWDGMNQIVMRLIEDEGAALEFLGLPARSISALLGEKA